MAWPGLVTPGLGEGLMCSHPSLDLFLAAGNTLSLPPCGRELALGLDVGLGPFFQQGEGNLQPFHPEWVTVPVTVTGAV